MYLSLLLSHVVPCIRTHRYLLLYHTPGWTQSETELREAVCGASRRPPEAVRYVRAVQSHEADMLLPALVPSRTPTHVPSTQGGGTYRGGPTAGGEGMCTLARCGDELRRLEA